MKTPIQISILVGAFFSLLALNAADKIEDNGSLNPAQIPENFTVADNMVYKTVSDQKLTFDFIQTKSNKNEDAPLLIHIHGGGWKGGSKETFYRRLFFDAARPLIEKGMKVATINYRLTKKGETTTVDSVTDCKDAIRFFVANAKRFGIDPKRFILMGGSAGGHLTLMTALAPDADYPTEDSRLDNELPPLAGAVPYYPLCHFGGDPIIMQGTSYGNPGRFTDMLGGPLEEKEELARQLSPVYLIKKDSPPIFILHGDADPVLPVLSARLFVEKARKLGARVKYLEVKNGNHGFRTADDPKLDGIIQQVTAYLDEQIYGKD